MSLFRSFIIRQLQREGSRTAVTVAGVAVGVSVVLAIRLANASSVGGFARALEAVSGRTSLEVVAPGVGVAERLLAGLGWLRDYGQVSPVIDGDALIRPVSDGGSRGEMVRVLGIDILRDQPFRDYRLASAGPQLITTQEFLSILTDERAIVLTRAFADRHGLQVGREVEMVVGDRIVPLVVRGVLEGDGPAQIQNGAFALMDIAAAQWAFDRIGAVDRVDVRLRAEVAIDVAEATIASRLPAGLSVQRPARRGEQVEKMLAAFQFNLEALSYISLLVGLFLVYNTISVSVITRRVEIGILRTVGAARRTILTLFLGQAVCLAVIGCALGIPLGWLLARAAVALTSSTVTLFWVAAAATVPALGVDDVALAFAVGVPLAIVAALVPALEAARAEPLSAVRDERELAVRAALPARYLAGAVTLFAVGGWCATRPAVGGLPVFGLVAALVVVFGAALLVPVVLYRVQRGRRHVDWWLGVEGTLARSHVGASVRRLSISVAALSVSLAMMVAISIMIGSFRETVSYWVGQTLQADLFVGSGRGGVAARPAGLSEDVEAIVAAHPHVVAIDGFRSVDVPYGDALVIVGSGRFRVLLEHGTLLFKSPRDGHRALADAVARGGDVVAVSESFSLRFEKHVGDVVDLPTPHGARSFEIAAVFYDYSSDRGMVVMDAPLFDASFDARRPSGLTVYLDAGAEPSQVRDDILAELDDRPVLINTNATLRRQVLEVFDSTFAITYALEGIAIVVSMLGVAATLLTLALERRRDTTILRLVGAERRHLRRVIMIEAGVIGCVSLGIGLVTGALLSLILIYVINVQSFGWTIQFHVPLGFLAQTTLLIAAGTALAGLYPARLAGRWTIADLSGEASE